MCIYNVFLSFFMFVFTIVCVYTLFRFHCDMYVCYVFY